MEYASGQLIHLNVTAQRTAAWTPQQPRETIPSDHEYHFIIHDDDAVFFRRTGPFDAAARA